MSSLILLVVIFLILGTVGYQENRGEHVSENALIRRMIRESRKPKPRVGRNPARFAYVGFMMPRRRRGLWRLLSWKAI